MSEKMKDGKWYVPKDLGIVKATEEQGGMYYRLKDVDGKDRWIPAKVFKRKYKPIDEHFIDDEKIKLSVDFCVCDRPDFVGEEEFQHFKEILAGFGKNLLYTLVTLEKLRKEGELSPSCAQYGKEDGDEKRDV